MKYKHILGIACVFVLIGILCVQNFSYALGFGQNITIYDNTSSLTNVWYQSQEDNEVEPGNTRAQEWDLEGFFLDGYTLTVIGGFNFADGANTITSGDIFLDIDGDAIYGGNQTKPNHRSNGLIDLNNTYGYDYAIKLNFDNNEFRVFDISNTDKTTSVYYSQNDWSSPWKYRANSNGNTSTIDTGTLTYYCPSNLINTGFQGYSSNSDHYGFSVDLSFLPPGTSFISHFTIKCGNDNLMGKGTLPVPEPATLLLFGSGLLGFAAFTRKKINKG